MVSHKSSNHPHICMCLQTHAHTKTHRHTHTYIYICIFICIYICIYTHTHTNMQIYWKYSLLSHNATYKWVFKAEYQLLNNQMVYTSLRNTTLASVRFSQLHIAIILWVRLSTCGLFFVYFGMLLCVIYTK